MIIAVLSDIHGNVYSLEKALKIIETFKPDKYLFLGDMAGYYYYQNESIQLLNTLNNLISIKGNHDEYFMNGLENPDIIKKLDAKYGKSYSMLINSITQNSMNFFNNLLDCERNEYFEAYHASPNDYTNEYIYPNTPISLKTSVPFVFLGHTHYPMYKKINDTIILNPGSIGQPRDFNEGSFSIVDLKDKKIETIRYQYDTSKLEKRIISLNDNNYLLEVLKRAKHDKS
jgi:predicted phosphodiesterase